MTTTDPTPPPPEPQTQNQQPQPSHPSNPTEANARLTALTGLTLLLLFAAEILTVVLGIQRVLTAHVVIGLLLTPPTLVKIGSVGWRMARYYLGDPHYKRRGAPPTALRVLGPILVALTLVLLASGVLAYIGPYSLHTLALNAHKVSFYLWLVALLCHLVPHFLEAVQLAVADLLRRTGVRVPGAMARRTLLLGALALGTLLAVALSGHAGTYLALFPKHH